MNKNLETLVEADKDIITDEPAIEEIGDINEVLKKTQLSMFEHNDINIAGQINHELMLTTNGVYYVCINHKCFGSIFKKRLLCPMCGEPVKIVTEFV